MKDAMARALSALVSLAVLGFSTGAAAGIMDITISPSSANVNLSANPSFRITYGTSNPAGACSGKGDFSTNTVASESAVSLGEIHRSLTNTGSPVVMTTIQEQVTIPAAVIEEIRRRQVASPIYYTRAWYDCSTRWFMDYTEFPILFSTATVVAFPAAARVQVGSSSRVPVRWRASFGEGTVARVESAAGRFVDGRGRVYGSPVRTLLQASGRSPLEFSEALEVPQGVVAEVLATGGGSGLRYERTFTVDGVSVVGALALNFTGRIASPFAVNRAELRFPDGSRFKTVPLGEEVLAVADLTFSGSGRLQGSWDLAGPTTTPGSAIFVRKELVDEHLSFGRRSQVRSPAIRAEQPGTYILRLTITEPDLGAGDALQVSFFVRATAAAVEIPLGQPPALARLAPGIAFTWEPAAGARSQLLEFYDAPAAEGREPVSGMVLPGDANSSSISKSALRRLQPGRTYWWRVTALDGDGALLGQSPLRELLPLER